MNREHEGRILIWLRDALFPLNLSKGLRVLTRTLPLMLDRVPARCRGKEMPLVGIEKALSDLPVDALPSRWALRFPVSFSAVVIVFCSSVAIIQPQTSFQLGDMRFSRKLSIAGNLSKFSLKLEGCRARILTSRELVFTLIGPGHSARVPGFSFLQRLTNSKTNFSPNATIFLK